MNVLLNPAPWQSIPQMLQDSCQRYQHRAAVIDGDTTLSYAELGIAVEQCANAIANSGVTAGDPVCIWAPNSRQWIVCAFACWNLGAVVVPISSRLKAREVGPVLQRSGARLLFSVSNCGGIDLPELLGADIGVSTTPGDTQFTRTLNRPTSCARLLENATSAALLPA